MTAHVEPHPKARASGLLVQDVAGETVVYDLDSQKAHCLNAATAAVWRACDGSRSVADLAALIPGADDRLPGDVVWAALLQLRSAGLLDAVPAPPPEIAGLSRRALLRRIGITGAAAAVAYPLITTITAPPAAAVGSPASCLNKNDPCIIANDQCCAGLICGNVGGNIKCH